MALQLAALNAHFAALSLASAARCGTIGRVTKPLRVALAFWTAFALLTTVNIYLSMITHGHSFARLFAYELAIWWAWAFALPAVGALGRRFPLEPLTARGILLHLLFATLFGVAHVALWITLTICIRPFDAMTISEFGSNFSPALAARIPSEMLLYLANLGAMLAYDSYTKLRERERSLAQARLHALELQLQPHFLFNTLHSISALVRNGKDDDAIEMIAGLSDILRYTLDRAGRQEVALEEETAILRRYLEIQQVRFRDRLAVTIEVADDARRGAVPALILQPLAENAIRHGIGRTAAAGRIDVRAFRRDGQLAVEIFNSGTLDPAAPPGIGLRNTEERLRQLYGGGQTFALRSVPGGVLATLSIPWSERR